MFGKDKNTTVVVNPQRLAEWAKSCRNLSKDQRDAINRVLSGSKAECDKRCVVNALKINKADIFDVR